MKKSISDGFVEGHLLRHLQDSHPHISTLSPCPFTLSVFTPLQQTTRRSRKPSFLEQTNSQGGDTEAKKYPLKWRKPPENKILTESNLGHLTKLAHQFWFSTSYAPPGSGSGRGQTEDEKKEKKEQAEAVARAEIAFQAAQQQRIQQRAEREQREFEREVREQTEYMQQRERDLIQQQRECRSASLQSM